MDTINYILWTSLVILVSFIAFIVFITVHIAKKQKFTKKSYIILSLILFGMYLFVPNRLYLLGAFYSDPELLQKALKLSINPYERRLCNYQLGEVYGGFFADELNPKYGKIIDGNKAISYYEKALKNYKGYISNTSLINLYLLKGDYDKVIELGNGKHKFFEYSAYIMQDKYEEALKYFDAKSNSPEYLYLKSLLLEKVGNIAEAKIVKHEADKQYTKKLKASNKPDELKKDILRYKSVEAYKNYIRNKSKIYGFI